MKKAKPRILVIASWYKSAESPWQGSFIEEQARLLVGNGHDVWVLHPYLKGRFFETIHNRKNSLEYTTDRELPTLRLGVAPFFVGFRQMSYCKLCRFAAAEMGSWFKKVGKPDIIHSHSAFMGGIVANHIARQYKLPYFHTEHTSGFLHRAAQYTPSDIKLVKNVYSHAKGVFFVSSFARERMISDYGLHPSDCAVVSNMVDDVFFTKPILIPGKKQFGFLIIGSLIPRKGHQLLLAAWKTHLQDFPDSLLTIAGDGPLKAQLMEFAQESRIGHSITWLPPLARHEVLEAIDNHHAIVSASQVETFGLTIAEALSRGRPVAVTDSGGVRDIVAGHCGIITQQSAEALSAGLAIIRMNFATFEPGKIQAYCRSKFSSEVIYRVLMNAYQRVL